MSNGDYISFFKPEIGTEEIEEVTECLKSGWLTTAGRAKRFETEFAKYVGQNHAVALNSCTAALHLAIEALGLKAKDVVLVPTFTFAATAEVVEYFGAYPVLVDCRKDDFNIDLAHARRILEDIESGKEVPGLPKDHGPVKGIMPVHFAGQPVDVAGVLALAKSFGLFVVDDCAHCCPAYYQKADGSWLMAGAEADIACYSFYANKAITTGEGGMATTARQDLADRMRVMSLHGISKDAWMRFQRHGSWYYEVHAPGFKYNMPDVAAAIGLRQLEKSDRFWARRKALADGYSLMLSGVPGVVTPVVAPDKKHCWHLYILRIIAKEFGMTRNALIDHLKGRDIGTSVHYMPLHLHPYYRDRYGVRPEHLPVATSLFDEVISMPLYPGMTDDQLSRVCAEVSAAAMPR